jgi:hypothetical protein
MRARAAATPTDWAIGIAALVEALAAGDSDADGFYRDSIAHLGKTPLQVALARSHLLYGEWLRRQGSRGEARDQLEIAHQELQGMGVEAFAARARRELSATTGRRARRFIDTPSTELTSQELQIASGARWPLESGIGSRLFLSPRTIEWHLTNVFKLGVSSERLRTRTSTCSWVTSKNASSHPSTASLARGGRVTGPGRIPWGTESHRQSGSSGGTSGPDAWCPSTRRRASGVTDARGQHHSERGRSVPRLGRST